MDRSTHQHCGHGILEYRSDITLQIVSVASNLVGSLEGKVTYPFTRKTVDPTRPVRSIYIYIYINPLIICIARRLLRDFHFHLSVFIPSLNITPFLETQSQCRSSTKYFSGFSSSVPIKFTPGGRPHTNQRLRKVGPDSGVVLQAPVHAKAIP